MRTFILTGISLLLLLSCPAQAMPFRSDTISDIGSNVSKVTLPTARGNKNERITFFRIYIAEATGVMTRVDLDFIGTTMLEDLRAVYIWNNHDHKRYTPENAELFGKASPAEGIVSVSGSSMLRKGWNYIWITADISKRAREGNQVEISAVSCMIDDNNKIVIPKVTGSRNILLTHSLVFTGGDYESRNYRIPAVVTAKDGALVTLTDKRWSNQFDLPRHIDLVARRSTNKGKTWSDPVTVAGEGQRIGFGDAALLCNQTNGEILALFAAGQGFFWSRRGNPIRIFKSVSRDHGITWSPPEDLTHLIYGYYCDNPITNRWQGAFVSSGNLTQLRSGRIIAALVVRESTDFDISNFVMYSDDNGRSWQVSPNRVAEKGNEAKILELETGDLLMSIRNKGYRKFSLSKDQGFTWEEIEFGDKLVDPSCNGSFTRYSLKSSGALKDRILHSLPQSDIRENMNVMLSYDEGQNWPVKKSIYTGPSAYSSMTVLKDGTIGLYYEVGEYEIYQMYFARFSLEWLTDGQDHPDYALKQELVAEHECAPQQNAMTIYPNPTSGYCRIEGTFKRNDRISIISVTGQIISEIKVTDDTAILKLSLTGKPSGMYWVRHNQSSQKLIIQ